MESIHKPPGRLKPEPFPKRNLKMPSIEHMCPYMVHRWLVQAQRLYSYPEIQRAALFHHIAILRQHAVMPGRLLALDDLAERLEVQS